MCIHIYIYIYIYVYMCIHIYIYIYIYTYTSGNPQKYFIFLSFFTILDGLPYLKSLIEWFWSDAERLLILPFFIPSETSILVILELSNFWRALRCPQVVPHRLPDGFWKFALFDFFGGTAARGPAQDLPQTCPRAAPRPTRVILTFLYIYIYIYIYICMYVYLWWLFLFIYFYVFIYVLFFSGFPVAKSRPAFSSGFDQKY